MSYNRESDGDKLLKGKIITAIKVAADRGALLIHTLTESYVVRADGDCCSHTWIENVELPALGFPATVISVTGLDMPEQPDSKFEGSTADSECRQFYGCKIVTDRGEIVIDYRNDSNGYYGGNLSWPVKDDYFYGGVFGQNVSALDWHDL
jgi:hypothetical protein